MRCKCGRWMHLDNGSEVEDAHWRCTPCEDKAIEHANERREWNYYHGRN
jgi:hypothetical protein